MNPDPFQMVALRERSEQKRTQEEARKASLHAKAVARRRKAKRGGKR